MITGQAKTDYMREYMRKRRGLTKPDDKLDPVRPKPVKVRFNVRPELDPCRTNETCPVCPHNSDCVEVQSHSTPEAQSYNPMMVGYVPPKE